MAVKRAGFTIPGYAYPLNWNTSLGTVLPGQIAALGGNYAVLQTRYNIATQTATTIDSTPAVPDAGIVAMAKAAKAAGLKIVLKVHVQITSDADIQSHIAPGAFVAHNNATYSHSATTLTIPTASFDSTWVGRRVVTPTPGHFEEIPSGLAANAYGAGITPNWTRISSVTNSTTVQLSALPAAGVNTTTGYVVIPDDAAVATFFTNYTTILDHLMTILTTSVGSGGAGLTAGEIMVDFSTEHDFMHILWDSDVATVGSSPALTSPWRTLVSHLRSTWTGITLTMGVPAANGYNAVRMWDAVDYIGLTWYKDVQSSSGGEDVGTIEANFVNYYTELSNLSSAWASKQIIFTELGFRSIVTAGYHPYVSGGGTASEADQSICVAAFMNTIYQQPWFAGFHWWTWAHPQNSDMAGEASSYSVTNADGTPKLAATTFQTALTTKAAFLSLNEFAGDYLPTVSKGVTAVPKGFVGLDDPSKIAGVTLKVGDVWWKTQPAVTPPPPQGYQPRQVPAYGTYMPDNTNTGIVSQPSALTVYNYPGTSDVIITTAGTRLTSLDIYGRVIVQASNVIIEDCIIRGRRTQPPGDTAMIDCNNDLCQNLLVQDCTLAPQLPNFYSNAMIGHGYRALRNRSFWVNDHYGVYNKLGTSYPCNVEVAGCYMTDNVYWQGTTAQYPGQAIGPSTVTTAWGTTFSIPGYPIKPDGTHNDGMQCQGALGGSKSVWVHGNHIRINDAEQVVAVGQVDASKHPAGFSDPWPQLGTQNCHKRRTFNTGSVLQRFPDGRFPSNGQCIIVQQNTVQNPLQDTVVVENNWCDDGGYAFNLQALASSYTTMKAVVQNNKISNNFYNFSSSAPTGGVSVYPIRCDNKAGMLVQGVHPTNIGNVWWGSGPYGSDGVLLAEGTSTSHLGIVYDS